MKTRNPKQTIKLGLGESIAKPAAESSVGNNKGLPKKSPVKSLELDEEIDFFSKIKGLRPEKLEKDPRNVKPNPPGSMVDSTPTPTTMKKAATPPNISTTQSKGSAGREYAASFPQSPEMTSVSPHGTVRPKRIQNEATDKLSSASPSTKRKTEGPEPHKGKKPVTRQDTSEEARLSAANERFKRLIEGTELSTKPPLRAEPLSREEMEEFKAKMQRTRDYL